MQNNYYKISQSDLGKDAKIPIVKVDSSDSAFFALAKEMFDTIKENNTHGKKTVFICPVGPVGHYPIFVKMVNDEKLSLKDVWFFNMDEYLDDNKKYIDINSKLSFRGFMNREVYQKIDKNLVMDEKQRVFPNPDNVKEVDDWIESLGGVDICFGGIGINGHVAFNEPRPELSTNEFANLGTRILEISKETMVANAIGDLGGAIGAMPKYCITIGMKQIISARKIRLAVFRDWHRAVCRRAAYGEVESSFPVSLLQKHSDIKLIVNDVAAKGIEF